LNSTSDVFQRYANFYDNLYQDKDYDAECDFLEKIFEHYAEKKIHSILDLGCGTGGHAIPLAQRGYQVFGVDLSEQMLAMAQEKVHNTGLSASLQFKHANVQDVNIGQKFDAVICMFAVLSYQISNEDLSATIHTARQHLNPGGVFICDFWYGPAVLKQRPTDRVKIIQKDNDRIIRLVSPETDTLNHIVKVNYHILKLKGDKLTEESRETHPMRFIFYPELNMLMSQANLNLIHFCAFGEIDKSVSEDTWNVSAIACTI